METIQSSDETQLQTLQNTREEVPATQQKQHVKGTADCCVVCLDDISEVCEVIPCHHRNFDFLCLVSWLERSPKCPLCKAVVSKVIHGFDGPDTKTYVVPKPAPDRQPSVTFARESYRPRRRRRMHQQVEPTSEPASSDDLVRRREVYRHNRYSKHVGSNRVSRYQELTPRMFCTDGELVSRARMWIRRELQVFSFLNIDSTEDQAAGIRSNLDVGNATERRRRANNSEFLLEHIIAILKSVDMMGSRGQAEEMLADFLGRANTRLFLHELRAWLRSPFTTLEDWDRAVQYDADAPMDSRRARQNDVSTSAPRQVDTETSVQGGISRPTAGDFYRPSSAGPLRRVREAPSRTGPYRRRSEERDRQR